MQQKPLLIAAVVFAILAFAFLAVHIVPFILFGVLAILSYNVFQRSNPGFSLIGIFIKTGQQDQDVLMPPPAADQAYAPNNQPRNSRASSGPFLPTKIVRLPFNLLLVDIRSKRFGIRSGLFTKVYPFSALLSYDLSDDGDTITSGKMGAAATGAAIGALLINPLGMIAGAVIGGAGSRKNRATCRRMTMRLFVNDLHSSQIAIDLIKKEVRKDSKQYRRAIEKANEIIAVLNVIQANSYS